MPVYPGALRVTDYSPTENPFNTQEHVPPSSKIGEPQPFNLKTDREQRGSAKMWLLLLWCPVQDEVDRGGRRFGGSTHDETSAIERNIIGYDVRSL